MLNLSKICVLYKKLLCISDNLPLAKGKKVCYNKGAKGQGGTVQWQCKALESLEEITESERSSKIRNPIETSKDPAQSMIPISDRGFLSGTQRTSEPGSIGGSL